QGRDAAGGDPGTAACDHAGLCRARSQDALCRGDGRGHARGAGMGDAAGRAECGDDDLPGGQPGHRLSQVTAARTMADDALAFAPATHQLRLLAAGRTTAAELLELYLSRIERYNPDYNLVVAFDIERARAAAAARDRRRADGEPLSALAGLPITPKHAYEVTGRPATCGLAPLRDHVPAEDADAVALLRAAGAIPFGKTNLPAGASDWQSFNPIYGISRNPWNPERTVGGSSGGAAGAVAAGFTAFELGSDIGGSIRIPAHFCGVFGHKPTYG